MLRLELRLLQSLVVSLPLGSLMCLMSVVLLGVRLMAFWRLRLAEGMCLCSDATGNSLCLRVSVGCVAWLIRRVCPLSVYCVLCSLFCSEW